MTNEQSAQISISSFRRTTAFRAQFVLLTIMSSTMRSGLGRTGSRPSPTRFPICSLVLLKPSPSLPQRTMPILRASAGAPTCIPSSKACGKVVRPRRVDRRMKRNRSWRRTERPRGFGTVALVARSRIQCSTCDSRRIFSLLRPFLPILPLLSETWGSLNVSAFFLPACYRMITFLRVPPGTTGPEPNVSLYFTIVTHVTPSCCNNQSPSFVRTCGPALKQKSVPLLRRFGIKSSSRRNARVYYHVGTGSRVNRNCPSGSKQ